MIKKINIFPNPFLYKKARKCELYTPKLSDIFNASSQNIWENEVLEHIQDLRDTAQANAQNIMGLASNQIWDDPDKAPLSVFILRMMHPNEPGVIAWMPYINPEIIPSGKCIKNNESCLSIPKLIKKVRRHINVTIRYNILNKKEPIEQKIFGHLTPLSFAIQHEMDHLNGILIK